MNAIVTVVGEDKVGIIAAVCALLAENNVNILDLSQTILHGAFIRLWPWTVGVPVFHRGTADHAGGSGRQDGHFHPHSAEEIFDAMHRI